MSHTCLSAEVWSLLQSNNSITMAHGRLSFSLPLSKGTRKERREKKERASLMMSDDPKLALHQRFPKEDSGPYYLSVCPGTNFL